MGELLKPVHLFLHRLSGAGPLDRADVTAFSALLGSSKRFLKGETLVDQGDRSDTIWLIAEGWAFRQRLLTDGRRHIAAIMLPGELTEKGPVMPFGSGDAIVAATDMAAYPIGRRQLLALLDHHPALLKSLFYEELTRHAVSREWLLLLGKRRAAERLAYFFFETHARLNAMGLIDGNSFEFPLLQDDIADMVGMSTVHFNRTLQDLRTQGLVVWHDHRVEIPDPLRLARLAGFNPEMIRIAEEFKRRAARADRGDAEAARTEMGGGPARSHSARRCPLVSAT